MRTNKETIEIFYKYYCESEVFCGCGETPNCTECEIDKAIKSLEKQEPKKPIVEQYKTFYRCPVCDRYVNIGSRKFEYCPNCGQAIDWGSKD